MKEQKVLAERYAHALFDLGKESDSIDDFSAKFEHFQGLLKDNPELEDAYFSPVYPTDQRKNLVQALCDKLEWKNQVRNFLLLLADNGRTALFPEIHESFRQLCDEHFGRIHVKVTSATALSDDYLGQLTDKLKTQTGKEIILEAKVDKSLIGGVVVRLGDKMLDGSLSSKMSEMRERMLRQVQQS